MPRSFDLDTAIALWRRRYETDRRFLPDDIRELEQHVRDAVAARVEIGEDARAAFLDVMREVGEHEDVRAAYHEVRWGKVRRERRVGEELTWKLSMFKNYLKIAFRTLRRRTGYSLLNIAGLTLGMTCCLLIFQYVAFETSFDDFHAKRDRIARVVVDIEQNGIEQGSVAAHGFQFGPTMEREVPGIARSVRVHPNYGDAILSAEGPDGPRAFTETGTVHYVDSTFLSVFDFPLRYGDPSSALRQPKTLLLSVSAARKYFGEEDVVGRPMAFTGWTQDTYTVAGVLEDVPATSHLDFDVLLPLQDLLATGRFDGGNSPWAWQNFITYFELEPNADRAAAEALVTEVYTRNRREDFEQNQTRVQAHLQPITDIHLDGGEAAPEETTGRRRMVYFFTVVGLITLLIALVNYVNLATARAMDRSREVGVRKVVGAQKRQLVVQFLMESALLNGLALVLAVGLSLALLPVVNEVAGVEMTRALWLDGRFWALFLAVFGAGALMSGLYPAFVLSSFRPATVLKGKVAGLGSRTALRRILVVGQFAASIALLAGTLIVYNQLHYMQNLQTGLALDQVLVVKGPKVYAEGQERGPAMRSLKQAMLGMPAVQTVGMSGTTPGGGFDWYTRMYRKTADPSTGKPISATVIDAGFADVYGLDLAAGAAFREGMARPDSGAVPILVNETLVRELGFASNEAALNGLITNGDGEYVIRGVYRDFQWMSAHEEPGPTMFAYENGDGWFGMIYSARVHAANLPQTLVELENLYRTRFPGNPFDYSFADADFAAQYRADQRFATLFGGFAGVAVLIACLGLFGLASFTAQQRTKEIGVRKVLGASVAGLVALLSKDFVVLVGVAFLIAAPAAYVYMNGWLADFAYQIELGPGVFLLAGILALGIALLTVGVQAARAAMADPVKSLRYE